MTEDHIQILANAHTGTDFECVCWEAAQEIRSQADLLKRYEKQIASIIEAYNNSADCSTTAEVIINQLQEILDKE
jgi:hypothetical protein